MSKKFIKIISFIFLFVIISVALCACGGEPTAESGIVINGESIPYYSGKDDYVLVNSGVPFFTEYELKTEAFWSYSPLDVYGRATGAFACICKATLPTDERESISHLKPTGWGHNKQYNTSVVPGKSLYNRSHLLAHSLMSDDVHIENMVTGTQHMNQKTMQIFESQILNAARSGDFIMYRVTPVYEGKNLVCTGVLMEAYSANDEGESVEFCVFVYNIQPGIVIDYSTGSNKEGDPKKPNESNVGARVTVGSGISLGGSSEDNSGNTGDVPASSLEDGVGYFITAENSDGALYFSGTVTGGRFDASYDKMFAVTVYTEKAADGFCIFFLKSGAKNYIAMDDISTGAKIVTDIASASIFEWDQALSTAVVKEETNRRAFGVAKNGTHKNFSPYVSNQAEYNFAQFIPAD